MELTAHGFDENLQLALGGDPYGGMTSVGLRVPTALTPTNKSRYLFLLATFQIPERMHARILGYRQLVTIGQSVPGTDGALPYPVEFLVTSPFWHFSDGNISWHVQRIGKRLPYQVRPATAPAPLRGTAFRFAQGPALLYENFTVPGSGNLYVDMDTYTPPNQGRPWGTGMRSGFNTFYDNHTAYDYGEIVPMEADVEGPEVIGFFASVSQTDPSTRPLLNAPAVASTYSLGISPEDQFLLNFPNAVYWRVGGSLLVEITGGE